MKKVRLELDINLVEEFKAELYKDFVKRFERELDSRIQQAFEANMDVKRLRYEIQELKEAWIDSFKAKAGIFASNKSKVDIPILKKLGDFEKTDKVCPICLGFLSTDFNKEIFVCHNCNDYWREAKNDKNNRRTKKFTKK